MLDQFLRGDRSSSEATPLLAKTDEQDDDRQIKERSRNQVSHIYFLLVVVCGSIVFFYILYYVYAFFIAGVIRCESGAGKLILNNVMLSDLKNEGILSQLDANDPYVIFQYDGNQGRTSVFRDSGSSASWEGVNIEFPITQRSLDLKHKFYIAVIDDNVIIDDSSVGKVFLNLGQYIPTITREAHSFSVPSAGASPLEIVDSESRVQGEISLDFEVVCIRPNTPWKKARNLLYVA